MLLSVVIPAFDEESYLGRTLAAPLQPVGLRAHAGLDEPPVRPSLPAQAVGVARLVRGGAALRRWDAARGEKG
jgi:hypothetical protein